MNAPVVQVVETETTRQGRDLQQTTQRAIQNFANLQDTIKAFAVYTLNSFKQIADANVNKVTLEFGINVGGAAGIPYITKGSIGSNLKITVQCSFKAPEN
ncbi:MAG: CU044_2847 family protein [Methylococcales bacterium]|nr:CU044_2847 family protein [Methylococcales bacterium]